MKIDYDAVRDLLYLSFFAAYCRLPTAVCGSAALTPDL